MDSLFKESTLGPGTKHIGSYFRYNSDRFAAKASHLKQQEKSKKAVRDKFH